MDLHFLLAQSLDCWQVCHEGRALLRTGVGRPTVPSQM